MELHVTSLDVIHSFWARQLGVKADANPGSTTSPTSTRRRIQSFDIRCAELCGLFHGHMFQTGQVVSDARFQALDHTTAARLRAGDQEPQPYSPDYLPEPLRRAG